MSIRLLAFALLAGVCVAQAAPPKSKTPKQDAASAQPAPESIDVDALARSKDANGATPADADTPPADTAGTPAPETAAPTEAPPAEAAPSEAPPSANVEPAPPAEASAPPAEAPPSAEPPAADASAATPKVDPNEKAVTEKISVAAGCQARATSLLDSAEKADFKGATSAFDAKMRTALPPPKLKEAWDELAQFGKLVARGQSHLSSGEGYTVVMIPLIFEKANLVAQVACGTDGRIAGFYVKPAPMAAPNS